MQYWGSATQIFWKSHHSLNLPISYLVDESPNRKHTFYDLVEVCALCDVQMTLNHLKESKSLSQ